MKAPKQGEMMLKIHVNAIEKPVTNFKLSFISWQSECKNGHLPSR